VSRVNPLGEYGNQAAKPAGSDTYFFITSCTRSHLRGRRLARESHYDLFARSFSRREKKREKSSAIGRGNHVNLKIDPTEIHASIIVSLI